MLPKSWKKAIIVPIPKPKELNRYRSFFYSAVWMVLNRLRWKMGPPHEHLYGFTRDMSTVHSIATLLSTIYTTPYVVVFLDLKKAFELGSPLAIQEILIHKGIRGRLDS
ncbi:uncharacterized protein [Penaeus vannamei]|uniref:uncharacterized protein n=1 Tax=Penaeus vannamei TaxID=6689 RepID=UPI00387F4B4A